ncbi:MAG: ribosome small subunit-dependent GTPase A [Desulfovibrio sp.]
MKDNYIVTNELSNLTILGWSDFFQDGFEDLETKVGLPARVVGVRKGIILVSDGQNQWETKVSGKMHHDTRSLFPVVGDWVVVNDCMITAVLPRKNELSRGASGDRGRHDHGASKQQIMAANLDTVFIVCGLDRDFNVRRIERYITLVYNCGLSPVVVLTKADLHDDPEEFRNEVEEVAFGVSVHLSGFEGRNCVSELQGYLGDDSPKTITMIGSSGAGKSTLLNSIAGTDIQRTGAVSGVVHKGKHTTTERDLIVLPDGGMIIDNPGIREIALWGDGDGVSQTFADIEEYAEECRFRDCSHVSEPGCAVLKAVSDGHVTEERLASYHKMMREMEYISERQHKSADRIEKERWKDVAMLIKDMKKR